MSSSITIESINYDGEEAQVVFTPDNDPVTINLGVVTLPFVFEPFLLVPPREVYGSYTIYTLADKCTNFLVVPRPTPTPTPTPSPSTSSLPCSSNTPTPTPTNTPTPTPTNSLTPTPTPSYNSCGVYPDPPGPTPSNTATPTPTLTPNFNQCSV